MKYDGYLVEISHGTALENKHRIEAPLFISDNLKTLISESLTW